MAATRASLRVMPTRAKQAITRLGHAWAEARADTWRTFTTCLVYKDGSGYVKVVRDGVEVHRYRFGPE